VTRAVLFLFGCERFGPVHDHLLHLRHSCRQPVLQKFTNIKYGTGINQAWSLPKGLAKKSQSPIYRPAVAEVVRNYAVLT
jgi:hypothetical protein